MRGRGYAAGLELGARVAGAEAAESARVMCDSPRASGGASVSVSQVATEAPPDG